SDLGRAQRRRSRSATCQPMTRSPTISPRERPAIMRSTQPRRRWRRLASVASALSLGLAGLGIAPGPAHAGNLVPINGSGSTWSSLAVQQWGSSVDQYGIRVNYSAQGSSVGRTDFKNASVDFAVSEIPY